MRAILDRLNWEVLINFQKKKEASNLLIQMEAIEENLFQLVKNLLKIFRV